MIDQQILKDWVVVILDDEVDSLEVATTLLELHGATIVTGSDGKEGLALIRKHHPRFVISDLSMPVMSGWELMTTLKKGDRMLAEIPVIALTAHAMEHERRKAIEMGFHNFITKPLQPETFVSQVIQLLAVDIAELKPYKT